VAAGVPDAIANSIAHRTKLAEAEKYLASQEAARENQGAGLDDSRQQPPADDGATSEGWTPEVRDALEDGLGEVPAKAIADEIARLRAELAEVKSQAQVSVEATRAQHRAAAAETLNKAVGELAGRFPGLVRDGILDPSVGQTAAAILHTPLIGGDLNKALEQAARMRFPEAGGTSRQSNQTAPARDTLAPEPSPQPAGDQLSERDRFARLARAAGQFSNNEGRAVEELQRLKRQLGR